LAVENPAVTDSNGARADSCDVGARHRLGEQLAPDLLAPKQRREVAVPLGARAVGEDRWSDHAEPDADDAGRDLVGGSLLVEDLLMDGAEALPAVLSRPSDPGEAGGVERSLVRPDLGDQLRA